MKRAGMVLLFGVLFGYLVILPVSGQKNEEQTEEGIIVTAANFQNNTGKKEYEGLEEAIPNSIITNFAASGKVSVVERSQLEEALEEMKLSMEGIVGEQSAAEAGKAVGAGAIIVGDFFIVGDKMRINARLIDVQSAKIIFGESVQGPTGEDIFGLIDQLSNALLQKIIGQQREKNKPPLASFSFNPKNPKVGESVSFTAEKSKDPDGNIIAYEWDFDNDGKTDSSDIRTSYQYLSAGEHTITLRVIDDLGATNAVTQKIKIVLPNQKPKPKFTFSPTQPEINQEVAFDASGSQDPDGEIIRYEWDFDDDGRIDAEGTHVTTDFPSSKKYRVKLIVTDNKGAKESITKEIDVARPNQKPIPSFTFSPSQPEVGEVVKLNASGSRDPDGLIVKYEWDFDTDGKVDAEGIKVSHQFQSAGSKQVMLRVVDDRGVANSITQEMEILSPTKQEKVQPNQSEKKAKSETTSKTSPSGTKTEHDFSQGRFFGIGSVLIIPEARIYITDSFAVEGTYIPENIFGLEDIKKFMGIGICYKITNSKRFDYYIALRALQATEHFHTLTDYDDILVLSIGLDFSISQNLTIFAELGLFQCRHSWWRGNYRQDSWWTSGPFPLFGVSLYL